MQEKKVEYLELIYDLIFVYLVGRNNELLHELSGGFFTPGTGAVYLMATLVVLQIWFFSMLYINRYGSNGVKDHIGVFINMYLLYYVGTGTRLQWEAYGSYNAAWGLILLHLALQYLLLLRRGDLQEREVRYIRAHAGVLAAQGALVFASIPIYHATQLPLSWLALLLGFAALLLTLTQDAMMPVNFEHLSERVMLYIVFTFGEMIVGIAGYFEGGFELRSVYFSLMAFLIVAGLFLRYGYLYDRMLDRRLYTTGTGYMLIHLVMIIALNNVTVALEFMRENEVNEAAKNIFLVGSLLLFYLTMFFLEAFAKTRYRAGKSEFLKLLALCLAFAAGMLFLHRSSLWGIALTAVFIYVMLLLLIRHRREADRAAEL